MVRLPSDPCQALITDRQGGSAETGLQPWKPSVFRMDHRGHTLTRACRPAHACSSRLEGNRGLFPAAAPRRRRVLVLPPQHHRENEQVCRLKQCPLVFTEQTFELSQKHPSGAPPPLPPLLPLLPPAPPAPAPPPPLPCCAGLAAEGGFFYFGFSAGGQSSPDVDSEMLPRLPPPPHISPLPRSLFGTVSNTLDFP